MQNPVLINDYQSLNNGNLYLASKNELSGSINNHNLFVSISSQIVGQDLGDSKSDVLTEIININNLRPINKIEKTNFVDPLIIDLDGDNILPLTDSDKNQQIKFEMLPGLELVDTNWLSKTVNIENPYETAFLAVNDFTNDINNNISLSSITEIFSEYSIKR